MLRNPDQALADLDKALNIEPDNILALQICGQLYCDLSNSLQLDLAEHVKAKLSNRFIRWINHQELIKLKKLAKGGFGTIHTACFSSDVNVKVVLKTVHQNNGIDGMLLSTYEVLNNPAKCS
jgi:hypothetical protein